MGRVTVRCVKDWDELATYQSLWDGLLDRLQMPTVYQTFEWNASFRSYYAGQAELLVLLAYEDDLLVGLAPLVTLRKRILGRWRHVVQHIGTHHEDYQYWLVDPDHTRVVEEMLRFLLSLDTKWDIWYLLNITDDSPFLDASRSFLGAHCNRFMVRQESVVPVYVSTDPAQDRKLVRKQDVMRREKRLRKLGEVDVRVAETPSEAHSMIDQFVAIHIARWGETPTPSYLRHESEQRLLHDMAEALVPKQMLRVWGLYYQRTPIALCTFLIRGQFAIYYRVAFDPAYSEYSAGRVVLKYALRDAVESGAKVISLGHGAEKYKFRYSNSLRHTSRLCVYSRRSAYLADRALFKLRDRLSPIIVESPLLRPIGTWARMRWPDLNL